MPLTLEKYKQAYAAFCEALLTPENTYPKTEAEKKECAFRLWQVLETDFKPDDINPNIIKVKSIRLTDWVDITGNEYAKWELEEYFKARQQKHQTLFYEFIAKKYQEIENPKLYLETEKISEELKAAYEMMYTKGSSEIKAIQTQYLNSISNPTSVKKEKIEKRFKRIVSYSIAYDAAFLKKMQLLLLDAKTLDDFRVPLLYLLYYNQFAQDRELQLNRLLEDPEHPARSLPEPFRTQTKAILAKHHPFKLIKKLNLMLEKVCPDFSVRAKQFFKFQGVAPNMVLHELEERCSVQLMNINIDYYQFLFEWVGEKMNNQAKDLSERYNHPIKMIADPDKIFHDQFKLYDALEAANKLGSMDAFCQFFALEKLHLFNLEFGRFRLEKQLEAHAQLMSTGREGASGYCVTVDTENFFQNWHAVKEKEKRYNKALEAKIRSENAQKAGEQQYQKKEMLHQQELERKTDKEKDKLKEGLEASFTKLSDSDKKLLADIIQHPRRFHHLLRAKKFCGLVQQLPFFQFTDTALGKRLWFNKRFIEDFHREHDKLLDGHVLYKFAKVFIDLKVDLLLLGVEPSIKSACKK